MARSGGRTFGLVIFGLTVALTASRAGTPGAPSPPNVVPSPPEPAPAPALPAPPSTPPAPALGVTLPPALTFPKPAAVVPPPPAGASPLAPEKPPVPEPEITEPVATVHRFEGKYIGGDRTRALLYTQTNADKAEIRSCPLTNTIPPADAIAKDDVKRIEVPTGAAVWHNGRAFLGTARELWVIDSGCRVDWKFVLPGKADNGEKLLGVAGFQGDDVVLASQHDPGDGPNGKRTGCILAFNTVTGRQSRFTTVEGGFDPDAKLLLDAPGGLLAAVGRVRVTRHSLNFDGQGEAAPFPAGTITHAATTTGEMFATTTQGIVGLLNHGRVLALPNATGTASPAVRPNRHNTRLYAPIKSSAGHFSLTAVDVWEPNAPKWSVRVSKEITVPPVLRGQSVYFVAGHVIYRVNAGDGAICWKHTLALKPNESLTELMFADGELRAHGPGVLVRIEDRAEAPAGP